MLTFGMILPDPLASSKSFAQQYDLYANFVRTLIQSLVNTSRFIMDSGWILRMNVV